MTQISLNHQDNTMPAIKIKDTRIFVKHDMVRLAIFFNVFNKLGRDHFFTTFLMTFLHKKINGIISYANFFGKGS